MSKKIMAAILAGLMLFTAVGCTSEKNGTTDETVTEEQNENTPQMLTSVFKGNTLTLPEGFRIIEDASPYYNKDSGEITLLFVKDDYFYDDNGDYVSSNYVYKTCKYDKDLNLTQEKDVELFGDDHEAYANNCVILNDKIVCLSSKRADNENAFTVTIYDMVSGESKTSESINGLFDNREEGGWFYVNNLCVNGDGDIYLGSENEILVLNDSFVKKFSIPMDRWINSMASSPAGVFMSRRTLTKEAASQRSIPRQSPLATRYTPETTLVSLCSETAMTCMLNSRTVSTDAASRRKA